MTSTLKKGYGVLSEPVTEALKLAAQTEEIFLDFLKGKAMTALVHIIKKRLPR